MCSSGTSNIKAVEWFLKYARKGHSFMFYSFWISINLWRNTLFTQKKKIIFRTRYLCCASLNKHYKHILSAVFIADVGIPTWGPKDVVIKEVYERLSDHIQCAQSKGFLYLQWTRMNYFLTSPLENKFCSLSFLFTINSLYQLSKQI